MNKKLNNLLSRILVATLTVPISVLTLMANVQVAQAEEPNEFSTQAVADIVINEVLSNPLTGNEKVELYNKGVSSQIISSWTIRDASGTVVHTVPSATSISATGFYLADLGSTSVLNNSGDTVALKTDTGASVDSLSYGDGLTASIVAPSAGKTLGRVTDGTINWYSGLTATFGTTGATNGSPSVPALSTGSNVKIGTSNAINVINNTSKAAVSVDVTLGASSAATDTVTARLYDALNYKQGTIAGSAGAGTVTVTGIDTTTTTALVDGSISTRSYVTKNSVGISTAYVAGTSATKDIVAPTPTVTSPAAAIRVKATTYSVAGTTEAGSTVKLYADANNDGVADSATPTATGMVSGTSYTVSSPLTSNSANNFVVTATDTNNNETTTAVDILTITEDSTAPTAVTGLTATTDSTGKVTLTFNTSASTDVANYKVYTDNGTGTVNYTTALTTIAHPGRTYTSNVLVNGNHLFVVRALDDLTNESINTDAVSITVSGPKVETAAAPGAAADQTASNGFTFTPASTATGSTTFTVTNQGTTLPTGSVPSGMSFLGQYFEATANNSTAFPVMVRYYYTAAQLTAAGVTESQLTGIYYYDSASATWKPYSSTGVNTADVMMGSTQYAGYLWANADHFTPLAFAADKTAPTKPANTTAAGGDGQIELKWDSVSDAAGYWVRYRKASEKDTASYSTVYLSGSSNKSTTIKNLTNGILYELGAAAADSVGNISDYSVVEARPNVSGGSTEINPSSVQPTTTTTTTISTATSTPTIKTAIAETTTFIDYSPPTTSETVTPTPTESKVSVIEPKDDDSKVTVANDEGKTASEKDNQNRARLYITLLILLIAAGAGAAGYYGYQWWTERPVAETIQAPEVTEPKPKKKSTRGGRW